MGEAERAACQGFQPFLRLVFKTTLRGQKKSLLENKMAIRVESAREINSGRLIGYCISTMNEKKNGEIDSIYIEPEYRGQGIGDAFMRRALEWMNAQAVQSKMLTVAEGNERVFAFYKRYGFYPGATSLM